MKKLLTILFALSFLFAKSQYVVPRGLPFKDSRYLNFSAPQGYILIDTLAMFRSSDTLMKPLFPAIKWAYGGFYQWDLSQWSIIGTGQAGNFYDTLIQITDTSFYAAKPDGTQDTIEIATTGGGGGGGGGGGTVTSVATGLGLSGGTIITSGTIILDTASPVVLSRQRAAATYEPIITASNTVNQYWNGYKQFVTLNTDSIGEGSVNLFFTELRARQSLSLTTTGTGGAATYNSTTGVFNIPVYNSGTVTSVGLSMPSAFTVTNSPVTSSGTLTVTGAGTTSQYIRGDGTLSTFTTDARTSISLTTTGTSGVATYDNSTGVLNVPNYSGGVVTSVTNSDGTLTVSPTTGAVIASLNLAHANTWSAKQTFATGTTSLAPINIPAGTLTTGGSIANGNVEFNGTHMYMTIGGVQTQLDNQLGLFSLAAIGSSPNANGASYSSSTFNLEPASASFGGVVTTGTQTLAGDKTLPGNTYLTGTVQTNATTENGNFNVQNTTSIGAQTSNTRYRVASISTEYRVAIGSGSATPTLTANGNYASVIIPVETVVEASSGTHNHITQLYIQTPTVTDAGASVTRTSALFINSGGTGASGATNNGIYNVNATNLLSANLSTNSTTTTNDVTTSTGVLGFGAGGVNVDFYAKQATSNTTNNTMDINAAVTQTATSGTATAVGVNSGITTFGNAVASNYIGFRAAITNDGTGTITNAIGVDINFALGSNASANAGVFTNGYGIKINPPSRVDSATFGTFYGVYVDSIKASWVTGTAYGIKQVKNFNNTIKNVLEGNTLVGSGTQDASAALQVISIAQGFLPPVMTGAQAEAITSPAAGLLVFASSGNGVTITSVGWWGYTGSTWSKLN